MPSKKFIRCTPHLPVKAIRQTLDYYRDTLGFTNEWTWPEEGAITDGGIQRDEMHLLFVENAELTLSNNTYAKHLPLLWFVENIEAIFEEFKSRDIAIADELRTHPYGLKEFAFIDINGYYIRVAEP